MQDTKQTAANAVFRGLQFISQPTSTQALSTELSASVVTALAVTTRWLRLSVTQSAPRNSSNHMDELGGTQSVTPTTLVSAWVVLNTSELGLRDNI